MNEYGRLRVYIDSKLVNPLDALSENSIICMTALRLTES